MCDLKWAFKWLDWAEAKLHWLHLNGLSPVWSCIMWSFNWLVLMHEYSHIVHLCGFSPECVLLCFFRSPDCVVLYSHWLQLYSFPRCASWYAFWGRRPCCMKSCTACTCAVFPRCEWGNGSPKRVSDWRTCYIVGNWTSWPQCGFACEGKDCTYLQMSQVIWSGISFSVRRFLLTDKKLKSSCSMQIHFSFHRHLVSPLWSTVLHQVHRDIVTYHAYFDRSGFILSFCIAYETQ